MKYTFLLLFSLQAFALKFVVVSDFNGSYGSTKYSSLVTSAIDDIIKKKYPLVLSTGDMVAGQKVGLNYKSMWNSFHMHVTKKLIDAKIPFAVTPGNHDASLGSKFKVERDLFKQEFSKFKPKLNYISDENYPMFYAFEVEGNLFVSMDITSLYMSKKQKTWLKSVLASSFKRKIVYSHIPTFGFVPKKSKEVLMDQELDNILEAHGVDLYLSGHHHAYYPGFNERSHMHMVSMPCLGSGSRVLRSMDYRSSKGYVEVTLGDEIMVENYELRDKVFVKTNKDTLPQRLDFQYKTLIRDDLK
ncbi:MAG: metallophosphoesterase [Bacteriovoracaceae bacterium]|jgi:2',3'-cyclic-nucleotide 2'-phosphodiesterase (5'-nucleotidase family)|nr:metallophosphoesterase [Bacteriovoracaceae bacterium]